MRGFFGVLLLVCLCGMMVLPVLADVPTPDCYYKFDEGSGSSVADEVGTNTGLLSGAGWDVGGWIGSAVKFDGINDVVTQSVYSGFDWASSDFAVSIWIYPYNVTSYQGVWCSSGLGSRMVAVRVSNAGDMLFRLIGASSTVDIVAVGVVQANVWSHWVFVVDRNGFGIIYKNGVNVAQSDVSGSGSLAPTGGYPYFGEDYGFGHYFGGLMDEFRFYDYALSSGEVQEIYGYEPEPSATPIVTTSGFTSDFLVLWVVLIFIVVGFFMMVLPLPWLPRFVFGVLSLGVCAVALNTTIVLQPYIQLTGLVMSVMVMLVAAVKGRS